MNEAESREMKEDKVIIKIRNFGKINTEVYVKFHQKHKTKRSTTTNNNPKDEAKGWSK